MITFLNGRFVPEAEAVISVSDRGFMYGDGLFETVRVANGWLFRMPQHLERLSRGANFLKISLPFTARELHQFAEQLVQKNEMTEAVLRMTLTRGRGDRGYTSKTNSPPTVAITLHNAPSPENPVQWNLITSSFHVLAADPLSSFKTLNKLTHVMARAEAVEKGADEALLINTNGEVAETASGNIFWIYNERICTTPTGRGVLPGITRAVVLEICQTLGLQTNKRVIKPEALRNSEGIFLTQSAHGIVPIATFDGEPVATSPLVDQIFNAYHESLAKP
jgi:branched-chain amino acid aminotransferase